MQSTSQSHPHASRSKRLPPGFTLVGTLACLLATSCGGSREEETGTAPAPIAALGAALGAATLELPEPRQTVPLPGMDGLDEELVLQIEAAVRALEEDLSNPSLWYELGMVYESARLRELALSCYEQVLLSDPENPRVWYRTALSRWRLGDPDAGLVDMDRVLELAPEYAPAYFRRGIMQLDAGDMQGAWDSFARGKEIDPTYVGCWVGAARVNLQRDESLEAVATLERILEQHPMDAKVHNLLVTAYRQAGIQSDLTLMETSVLGDSPNPDWGDPWQEELASTRLDGFLARVRAHLRSDGDPQLAVELLEERRLERPEEQTYETYLAEAYFKLERVDDARRIYKQILQREPDNVRARIQLARYHQHEGHPRIAVLRLDEILELDGTNGAVWLTKGSILFGEEQYELAIPALKRGFELDQRDPEPLLWLGESYTALMQWGRAARAFADYVERVPEAADVYLDWARAAAKLKNLESAEAALERALELGADRPQQVQRVELLIKNLRERTERRKPR